MATTSAGAPSATTPRWASETPAARAWRRLKRRKGAMLGLFIILVMIFLRDGIVPTLARRFGAQQGEGKP